MRTRRDAPGQVDGAAPGELVEPPVRSVESGVLTDHRHRRAPARPARGFVELPPRDGHALPRPCRHPLRRVVERTHEVVDPADEQLARTRWASCTRMYATSSATLRSVSCPTPVITGTSIAAIARATSSVSNGARSARDHRPAPSTTTSTSSCASCPQRPLDPLRGARALHRDVDHADPPRVGDAQQLVDEVVVGGAALAGDQADAQRHRRQLDVAALAPSEPLGGEGAQHAVAVGREPTDGEDRVDAGHDQLVLTGGRVDPDAAPDPHLDVVAERRAGHLGQRPTDLRRVVA